MNEADKESTRSTAAEAVRLMGARGWEPGDDICPPWWPRRPWPWPPRRVIDTHLDLLAADRVYHALTLLASSFQWSDGGLIRGVRSIALANLREAAQMLTRGAVHAWEPGDDICPPWPWRRWPIPPPPPWWRLDPEPSPWLDRASSNPMPGRAAGLLDALGLLQAYNVAAKVVDGGAREAATVALGKALAVQVESLGKQLD